MKREYKIYCLKHPVSLNIRYIGVTTCSLRQRLAHHKYAALKQNKPTRVAKWIRSIEKQALFPIIELIEITDKQNWEEREKHWISYYNNLTNIRKGGAGVVIERPYEGKQRSIDAHKKPIVLLDREYNLIKEFCSVKTCAEFLEVGHTSVGNALKEPTRGTRGYIVLYKKDYISGNYEKVYTGHYRYVYQYDENKQLIKKHNSVFETTQQTGFKSNHIDKACVEGWKHKGFYWSYSPLNQ